MGEPPPTTEHPNVLGGQGNGMRWDPPGFLAELGTSQHPHGEQSMGQLCRDQCRSIGCPQDGCPILGDS